MVIVSQPVIYTITSLRRKDTQRFVFSGDKTMYRGICLGNIPFVHIHTNNTAQTQVQLCILMNLTMCKFLSNYTGTYINICKPLTCKQTCSVLTWFHCTLSAAEMRDPLLQDIEELQKSFMMMDKSKQDTQGLCYTRMAWYCFSLYNGVCCLKLDFIFLDLTLVPLSNLVVTHYPFE